MPSYREGHRYNWSLGQTTHVEGFVYTCGYCGTRTAPKVSVHGELLVNNNLVGRHSWIHFCPVCLQPTYLSGFDEQVPAVRLGADLKKVPADGLKQLYDEARDCSAAGAYTACVMACRKVLMNLAVREGAPAGQSFVFYVDYLANNNFVPPKGRPWVDKIREKGNEANHEIKPMSKADAEEIMHLVEMLLRFNFELGTPTP